jgi:hypothetical protein
MEQGVGENIIEIYGEASQNPLCSITLKDEELFITASECLEETCMMLESLNIFENVNISVMQFKNMSNDRVIDSNERIFRGTFLRLHSNKGEKKTTIYVSVYLPNDEIPISIAIRDKNNATVNYVAAKAAELMGHSFGYYHIQHERATVEDGDIFHATAKEDQDLDGFIRELDTIFSFIASNSKMRLFMRELEENVPELFANVHFAHPYKNDPILVRVVVFNGKESTNTVLNRAYKCVRMKATFSKLPVVYAVGYEHQAPVTWIEAGKDYIAKIK